MLTTIDLTGGSICARELPEPTLVCEHADVVIQFADVSISMSLDQFQKLYDLLKRWHEGVPAQEVVSTDDELPEAP